MPAKKKETKEISESEARRRKNVARGNRNKVAPLKRKWLEEYGNIEKNWGVRGNASKAVGISRQAFCRWLKTDPEFKAAVEELEEQKLDYFETIVLKEAYDAKNTKLLEMMTRQWLKGRGYDNPKKFDINANLTLLGLDDLRKK